MAAISDKLKICEVCAANKAKYTCPKCEVRTCGIPCLNIHKKELNCDGIRDKTKFISLNSFTDLDLLCDYRLLEDIGRSVENFKQNPEKKYTRQKILPLHLNRLKSVAHNKSIYLEFLPQNFSKHKENTTFFNWKSKEFFWRVELIFSQAENTKWILERVLDSTKLSNLLEEIFNPTDLLKFRKNESFNELSTLQNKLKYYRAHGLSGLTALLKAEKVKKSNSRFYELDLTLSLQENLKNKTIIEFPIIYIIFKDHSDMFEIIDSDDEEVKPKVPISWKSSKGNLKNGRNDIKGERDSSFNYFFNSELSDSENEDTLATSCDKIKNKELYIPHYNELVKMEY